MTNTLLRSLGLIVAAVTSTAATVRATDVWTLTTADLSTRAVQLQGIDPAGVKVANADGNNDRVIPLDQFVELDRPLPGSPMAGKYVLHLTSGDRVAGDPVGMKGESVVWRNAVLGDVSVPLTRLRAMTKPNQKAGDERRKEDVVTLSNRDVVRGAIADLTGEKLTLQAEAGLTELPLASVESVAFAATAAAPRADAVGYRVRLDEGSSIVGTGVAAAGGRVTLTVGGAPREFDLGRVTAIEQVNGPVSWLSSRTPAEAVYTPYLGSHQLYPARMNRNYLGEPMFFKDKRYERGIGVHSYSRLVFPLDGKTYAAFRTRYAIDGNPEKADVTVRVRLDDKVVHEQAHVRAGTLSPVVVMDLGEAKTLTLEVDYGANIDSEDRLNWIEPALMKVKPAAEPAAAPTTAPSTKPR